ncbi:MAG: NUDIX hydrolase [Chloroflexota bacterium]|nr:NUDIX hydrolase [Chloroflexota bacterium]
MTDKKFESFKKGPWTVIDSRTVYENPWITVREDKVIRPDNREGIFGVVEMKPGVSVLPLDDEGNVYLTQEFHYAVGRETIEAISGGIDQGEDKLDAARRELKEEAGIVANEWIDLGVIDPFTTVVSSPSHIFLARGLEFSEPDPDGTEIIRIVKTSLHEAVEWVMEGKITHGATTTLILKAKHYIDLREARGGVRNLA